MRRTRATWLLALLIPAPVVSGQEEPEAHERTVTARLSFSVEQYDPSRPSQAVVKCVVRNGTPWGIHVPVGYDDGFVRMRSGQLRLRRARAREERDVKLAWVEPGREQVVFQLPLDEILRTAAGEPHWAWDWPRRPEPPRSPIHRYRQPGFVDEASFTVSLDMGGSTLTSDAATLKVKSEGGGSGR